MTNIKQIKPYTREDFLQGTEPYEFAYQYIDDPFTLGRVLEEMSALALAVKVRNFKALFKSYVQMQKANSGVIVASSSTQFEDQPLELNSGQWRADDTGIYLDSPMGEVCACTHPVLPVQRLVNIDTGVEKLQLAYRKSRQWRRIVVEKKTIASNNSIVELANLGVSVTSENARFLVKYLHDIETLNYDLIPERSAVSRLGWIDGEGFAPYVEDLVFDGDANFRHYFEAVKPCGSYDKWLELAKVIRCKAVPARIILAASFASALIKPLSCLPFFVHLWGGTEAGKTVGLMLAASVWAAPEMGKYIHTFNSTAVGMEKAAAFCNSMPLILDELQIMANRKSFDEDIMKLAEGVGKTRGNKLGGVDMTPTWNNCILTNGEMPITGSTSGGGAVNRIVEIECVERLFEDPRSVVDIVKRNYGHAGKQFVDIIQQDGVMDVAGELYRHFYEELSNSDTTEKQAMAAAAILTADAVATVYIFRDDAALTVEDISPYLQEKAAVSVNQRGYDYLCEFIVANAARFEREDGCQQEERGEVWGRIRSGHISIIRSIYNRICADAGYNQQALLSWMNQHDLIIHKGKNLTSGERINGIPTQCVKLVMTDSWGFDSDEAPDELI